MDPASIRTSAELVAHVQRLLDERRFDEAIACETVVDERFADDAVAQHLIGLVWERTWLERTAEGLRPPLDHHAFAAERYRRAAELDDANRLLHVERLFACLFVLGTQRSDAGTLREALALADELAAAAEGPAREAILRESAVAASGLARVTRAADDWLEAERRHDAATEPPPGRETFFFHYYRGMAKREAAAIRSSEQALREAVAAFLRAREADTNAALEYLLADCLLQLQEPSAAEIDLADELVAGLLARSPDDRLAKALAERHAARLRLLDGNSEGSP